MNFFSFFPSNWKRFFFFWFLSDNGVFLIGKAVSTAFGERKSTFKCAKQAAATATTKRFKESYLTIIETEISKGNGKKDDKWVERNEKYALCSVKCVVCTEANHFPILHLNFLSGLLANHIFVCFKCCIFFHLNLCNMRQFFNCSPNPLHSFNTRKRKCNTICDICTWILLLFFLFYLLSFVSFEWQPN